MFISELTEDDKERWEAFTSGQLADTNKRNTVDLVSLIQTPQLLNAKMCFQSTLLHSIYTDVLKGEVPVVPKLFEGCLVVVLLVIRSVALCTR